MAQVQNNHVVLTEEEQSHLENLSLTEGWGEAYQYIANILRHIDNFHKASPAQFPALPDTYVPVMLWFEGAGLVNLATRPGDSGFADLIRYYSARQTHLHFGTAIHPFGSEMQRASNEVARNAINNILSNEGEIPSVDDIARLDATAVGLELFDSDAKDTAFTDNAAWSGTILFSLLGNDQTGLLLRDRGSNTGIEQFNNLEDLRNVLFSLDAFDYAMQQAVGNASFSSVWKDVFLPVGIRFGLLITVAIYYLVLLSASLIIIMKRFY